MMLGAFPPSVMIPWILSVERMCWRNVERFT